MCPRQEAPKPITPAPPPPAPPVLDQAAPQSAKVTSGETAKKAAVGNRKYRTSLGVADTGANTGRTGLSIN
jgi:hypothetical protein